MDIPQLMRRYGIKSKETLYKWLRRLDIKLAKHSDGKVRATPEQIARLDKLALHMKGGGRLATFVEDGRDGELETRQDEPLVVGEARLEDDLLIDVVAELVYRLDPRRDPAHDYERLDRWESEGWVLRTRDARALLGCLPKDGMRRGGYRIECQPYAWGRGHGWRLVRDD